MRLLLLTSNISEESKEIARSIINYISENHKDVIFHTIDVLRTLEGFKSNLVNKGYFFLCKNMNKLSNKIYKKSTLSTKKTFEKTLIYKLTKSTLPIIQGKIEMFEPDVILSTNTISTDLLCNLKQNNPMCFKNIKLFHIMQDFYVSSHFRFFKAIDYIVTPNELLNDKFIHLGVNTNQNILSFGIPLNEKFENDIPKDRACELLGFNAEDFQVVCFIPNYKFSQGKKLINNLLKSSSKINISIVCVKNQRLNIKLYNYARKVSAKNIRVYGITNNFNLLLSCADICICNPTGLIVSECIRKNVPIITTPKLSFGEIYNLDFLLKEKAIIKLDNFNKIDETIDSVALNPSYYDNLTENIQKLKINCTTKTLCNFIAKNNKNHSQKNNEKTTKKVSSIANKSKTSSKNKKSSTKSKETSSKIKTASKSKTIKSNSSAKKTKSASNIKNLKSDSSKNETQSNSSIKKIKSIN